MCYQNHRHCAMYLLLKEEILPTMAVIFLLDEIEKENLLKLEPQAEKFVKNFIGAKEFINGK